MKYTCADLVVALLLMRVSSDVSPLLWTIQSALRGLLIYSASISRYFVCEPSTTSCQLARFNFWHRDRIHVEVLNVMVGVF
jgi:hypothetical protein